MARKRRANLELASPIENLESLIVELYSTMNCYDVFRELRARGYPHRQQTVSKFIQSLGIMRKPGRLVPNRNIRPCKLCSSDYAPRSPSQVFCEVCVPAGDRTARICAAKFGVTRAQLDIQLSKQDNACDICKLKFDSHNVLQIDHDHQTGLMRGFLCTRCNLTLGAMEDNPVFLRSAAEYLEKVR